MYEARTGYVDGGRGPRNNSLAAPAFHLPTNDPRRLPSTMICLAKIHDHYYTLLASYMYVARSDLLGRITTIF